MKKLNYLIFLGLIIILGLASSFPVLAYQIENLTLPPAETIAGGRGDFVLGPGKVELWLEPGEKFTKYLNITNRLGRTIKFKIEIEDFVGTYNVDTTVQLLGGRESPYSLKDYLDPEITEFTLENGQRITLPVEIAIPEDTEPGGLYGSVLVSTQALEAGPEETQIKSISRLGSLFFIRVKGDVLEQGFLKSFTTPEKFYKKGPIDFEILFENTGNVHLNPYGIIEIKNLLGQKIDEIELEPWFAMPDSLRLRETKWEREWLFGRYTATAKINRGYQDIIDEKSIVFWIIPWKIILPGFIILVIIIGLFKWIFSHFEIRRKSAAAP